MRMTVKHRYRFCLRCHAVELGAVAANIRHFVRDDLMMLCIDRDLDIIPDHSGPTAAGRHGTSIRISQ